MEPIQAALWVVILLVTMALVFDFMNGFHDAANSIATVVSTGVLKPGQAVLFAAFFNVAAIFVFHLSVAAHRRQRHRRGRHCRYPRGLRRSGGGHYVEPYHLVLRHPVQLLARLDRWAGGARAWPRAVSAP